MDIPSTNIDPGFNESESQALCKECGLCCDGTVFPNANTTEEDLKYLAKHPMDFALDKSKQHFKLPCRYHINKCCSVYSGWRPNICSTFFCATIIRFINMEITFEDAREIISNTLAHASKLRNSLATSDSSYNQNLGLLFHSYVDSHSMPDQLILLDYAAFQHRLKRHFHKQSKTVKISSKRM